MDRVETLTEIVQYEGIDEDSTERPMVHELVSAGIPREKIICLYLGEQVLEKSAE